MKPTTDAKIWKYEVKTQIADLTVSIEKCDAIVAVLEELQIKCARTSDDLKNVLNNIKEQLKQRMEANQIEIDALK